MKRILILDLDGTLLFGERRTGLMVEGHRRSSYLAEETLQELRRLQDTHDIFLATGRNVPSVQNIINLLLSEGVSIRGAVAENGGAWLDENGTVHYLVSREWMSAVQETSALASAQPSFATCAVLIDPSSKDLSVVYSRLKNFRYYCMREVKRSKEKVFVLHRGVNKCSALIYGIGRDRLKSAVGIGNDLNDIEWLDAVGFPVTLKCASEAVQEMVVKKGGLVSSMKGHDGILEVLSNFEKQEVKK